MVSQPHEIGDPAPDHVSYHLPLKAREIHSSLSSSWRHPVSTVGDSIYLQFVEVDTANERGSPS